MESIIFPIPPESRVDADGAGGATRGLSSGDAHHADIGGGRRGGIMPSAHSCWRDSSPSRDTNEASLFGDAVALYHEYGVLMVFLGGFTPIPYKVITIFSGAVGLDFVWFVVMSLVSRGLRFYLEAFFVRRWGAAAWHLAVYWLGWRTAIAITIIAIGGIIAYKLM